jgi:phosphoglycerol transferase
MLYVATAVLAFLGAFFIMHLWDMHLNVPLYFSRGGDELTTLVWVKALLDGGWVNTISHLGAPTGLSTGDFPVPAILHLSILKVLTLIVPDVAASTNLYFLAGFSLIAVSSAYVLRRFGISWPVSLIVSVVYALLPMRFYRNEAHLAYGQYYLYPILALAILWVYRSEELFDTSKRRPTRDGYIFIIGLVAVTGDNPYLAAFAIMLLALAGIASAIRTRAWKGAATAAAGIAILVAGVELSILPNTIYVMQHGKNPIAMAYSPEGTEVYALTLPQLVLPIQNHRIPAFAQLRARFDSGVPILANESSSATLGLLGAIGFVGSIGALMLFRANAIEALWSDLARLNIATFLLITIGSVGALIGFYFEPDLRGYNRFSPMIGFLSLATVAIVLDAIRQRWPESRARDRTWITAVALIGLLAIADQTSPSYVPAYAADLQAYTGDADFVALLERHFAPNAALYQIPYVPFPVWPSVVALGAWDQTALFLHSKTLRYSFGSTNGRPSGDWQEYVASQNPRQFIEQVILAGFDGVLVYRRGYIDNGKSIEKDLGSLLGQTPIVRDDGTISAFDLSNLRASYLNRAGASLASRVSSEALDPRKYRFDASVTAATKIVDELLAEKSR